MATNVELDEDLVERAFHATGIRTKRELIDAGLRALLRLHEQREIRDLRGRLRWEESEGVPGVPGKS
ncbi:MAG TPA: type II toxin-antitoxin system VapB family antitoxin [Thermoanaerobaculia bacterium]|jgi:Arc/MetJ family transcription regulator|nr:type II toxin-antitoxin system VapB family antitoxin [Thermoanaerobaculia bacterium]